MTPLILTAALVTGALLWLPALRRHDSWRAMITPLASIIGSGFLVLGPILAHGYGTWAPLAMALLCLAAWGFGAAIRANIARIGDAPAPASLPEQVASALLAFAYVISVAYYLNLFGAFAVELSPWQGRTPARLVTTAVFAVILGLGYGRGFTMLERAEYLTVTLKLAIIAGLLAGLALFFTGTARAGALILPDPAQQGLGVLTLGFGLLVKTVERGQWVAPPRPGKRSRRPDQTVTMTAPQARPTTPSSAAVTSHSTALCQPAETPAAAATATWWIAS